VDRGEGRGPRGQAGACAALGGSRGGAVSQGGGAMAAMAKPAMAALRGAGGHAAGMGRMRGTRRG